MVRSPVGLEKFITEKKFGSWDAALASLELYEGAREIDLRRAYTNARKRYLMTLIDEEPVLELDGSSIFSEIMMQELEEAGFRYTPSRRL